MDGWIKWDGPVVVLNYVAVLPTQISSFPLYFGVFYVASVLLNHRLLCSLGRKPYIGNKCWNRSWQPFSDCLLSRKRLQILVGRYLQASFSFLH